MNITSKHLVKNRRHHFFGRTNYLLFFLAAILECLGYYLMSGKGSSMTHFQPDIFSSTRIVLAPLCCFIGYLLILLAIVYGKRRDGKTIKGS